MCIIMIGEVTERQFRDAKAQNPDGFSVFTRELGLIKAPSEAIARQAFGKFAIWHFRIGTSGKIDESNIHPFPICKGRYLLYHNGVLGAGKGSLSDTAALAQTLYQVNLTTARSVVRSLAQSQRFVIADARDPRNFELFGPWTAEAGVLMSHPLVQTGGYYAARAVFKGSPEA